MSDPYAHARRDTDSFNYRAKQVVERVMLWLTVGALVVAVVRFYVETDETVKNAPANETRIVALETYKAVNEDRWQRIALWMDRIDKKLDRRRE